VKVSLFLYLVTFFLVFLKILIALCTYFSLIHYWILVNKVLLTKQEYSKTVPKQSIFANKTLVQI